MNKYVDTDKLLGWFFKKRPIIFVNSMMLWVGEKIHILKILKGNVWADELPLAFFKLWRVEEIFPNSNLTFFSRSFEYANRGAKKSKKIIQWIGNSTKIFRTAYTYCHNFLDLQSYISFFMCFDCNNWYLKMQDRIRKLKYIK